MVERIILPTPPALVEQGIPHAGFFEKPFRVANILDSKKPGRLLPGRPGYFFRLLRLKSWIGFGLGHPSLYGAILVQNAHYVAGCGAYFYFPETGKKYDWSIVTLPWRTRMPDTLWNARLVCSNRQNHVAFEHCLEKGCHRIKASFTGGNDVPPLQIDLVLHQPLDQIDPLVFSMPIKPAHHTYTHKSPVRLEGTVQIDGHSFEYKPERDLGNLDEQLTYYPYFTRWRWASFATRTDTGREIMLNLVNQMTPLEEPGEDALWIDGKIRLLNPAAITPAGSAGRYHIRSADGSVDLVFTAEGSRREKHQLILAAMDYYQYFGRFQGQIKDPADSQIYRIRDVYGPLEDMRARF